MKCKNCGGEFTKTVNKQKFCCDYCRSIYWFKHNRIKWNNYMREWTRGYRIKKVAKQLVDFVPGEKDFNDFDNF